MSLNRVHLSQNPQDELESSFGEGEDDEISEMAEISSEQDDISEMADSEIYSEISSRGLRRPPRSRFNITFKKCTYVYSGIACLRKTILKTDRCAYHQKDSTDPDEKIDPKIFNTECPICLETFDMVSRNSVHKNRCGHMIHLQCMEGMDKAECPTCRGPLVNSSTEMLRIIDRNAARNRRSTESENFTNLTTQFGDNDMVHEMFQNLTEQFGDNGLGRLVTALMPLARNLSSAMLERNNQ